MGSELVSYSDLQDMAMNVVRSKMFPGITTPEAAITLMLLCQAEGLHPMQAMMRYHVIQGRPAMKADAMLAEFMRRGGTVNWLQWDNQACEAEFKSHGCPEGVKVRWTMEDARRAGVVNNPTWTKYPRQMLKARVASDGVRMADPAVNQGRYTPEEVQDFDDKPKPTEYEVVAGEGEGVASPGVESAPAAPPAARIFSAGSTGGKTMGLPGEWTHPGVPAIQSASNPVSTDAWLEQAKENREAAVAETVIPIQEQLAKIREESNRKAGRPPKVPEFCPACDEAVMKYVREDDRLQYWECRLRNADRHKMKEAGVPEKDIRNLLAGHFFKWAGKAIEP
jgi:hypothetical protein